MPRIVLHTDCPADQARSLGGDGGHRRNILSHFVGNARDVVTISNQKRRRLTVFRLNEAGDFPGGDAACATKRKAAKALKLGRVFLPAQFQIGDRTGAVKKTPSNCENSDGEWRRSVRNWYPVLVLANYNTGTSRVRPSGG